MGLSFNVIPDIGGLTNNAAGTGIYRPSNWGSEQIAAVLTVPQSSQQQPTGQPPQQGQSTVYVFDAVLRLDHIQELVMTKHPVQTQANITDHAYRQPARITLEIGMSDAMDSYTAGEWSGGDTKSVNAYQTLLGIMESRVLVVLSTRIDTYQNVMIQRIETPDTNKTLHGLRCLVTFEEIFLATVTGVSSSLLVGVPGDTGDSARPQTTDQTSLGTVQPTIPTGSLLQQFNTGATTYTGITNYTNLVPGAGSWSSNNLSNLIGGAIP